jgi:hypothetical protein
MRPGHRIRPKRLSAAAETWLLRHPWPGNIRELSHLMERAILLHLEPVLDASALEKLCLPSPGGKVANGAGPAPGQEVGFDEPTRIREALVRTAGNVVQAARLLGLRRDALRHRMRRYGITPPTLDERWEHTISGRGQVIGMVGEPGVGKSRLVAGFTRARRPADGRLLESHAASYNKTTPYRPVVDLLKAYFQIEDHDEVHTIWETITRRLLAFDSVLESSVPALLTLFDVPVEDHSWLALEPPQRRQRTLDAVKHLLLRETQVAPLLVVFEDVHWIDSETQAVLDRLVDTLTAARFCLLVTYRPEYQHQWGNKACYTQLRLDPLSPTSAQELLRDLVGEHAGLQPLKRLLLDRTRGNPFFLEESIQTLVESRVLEGERGAYYLSRDLS